MDDQLLKNKNLIKEVFTCIAPRNETISYVSYDFVSYDYVI